MSPKSTSLMSPSETRCEKPMPRGSAQSSTEVTIAPRLGDEGQMPRMRTDVREAGVKPYFRRDHADAIGADDAQEMRPRGIQHRLLQLLPSLAFPSPNPAVMTTAAFVPRSAHAAINREQSVAASRSLPNPARWVATRRPVSNHAFNGCMRLTGMIEPSKPHLKRCGQ